MKDKLTPKQRSFVTHYLIDQNGAKAARAAGYSEKAAKEQASRMLTNANVKKEIELGLGKIIRKTESSAEKVLQRLAGLAFEKELIRDGDVIKACELLGKHHKLWTDVSEVNARVQAVAATPEQLAESYERNKKKYGPDSD
jgi:phage terminase small subunit